MQYSRVTFDWMKINTFLLRSMYMRHVVQAGCEPRSFTAVTNNFSLVLDLLRLTHGLHQSGHVCGGDGYPRGHFAVLPGVSVVGYHRRDAPRRRPPHGAYLADRSTAQHSTAGDEKKR